MIPIEWIGMLKVFSMLLKQGKGRGNALRKPCEHPIGVANNCSVCSSTISWMIRDDVADFVDCRNEKIVLKALATVK